MRSRVFILCTLFCVALAPLKAANTAPADSTTKHAVTNIYTESMLVPYNIWQQRAWTVDTMLENLEHYTTQYSLGNPGQPCVPVIFNSTPAPLGFFYGNDYLTNYFSTDASIRYYDTRAPYTTFFYVTDPQIHQFLDLFHTQNIGKKLNVAMEFHRIRSEGLYLNQGTNLNQLNLSVNYHSKRYMFLADGIYDIYKLNQNGGVQTDTDFSSPTFLFDRQTIPVYMLSAKTTMFERSFHFRQYYFFGYKSADTAHVKPLLYLSHELRIAGHSNVYYDPDLANDSILTSIYPRTWYNNDTMTYDSLRYKEFTNDFSVGSAKGWTSGLRWDAGIKDQWIHFTDYSAIWKYSTSGDLLVKGNTDTVISNLMVHARIYNTYFNNHLLFDAQGQEVFAGTQKGDMQGSADIGLRIDSLRLLKLSGMYSLQTPPFIYNEYYGNNFQWMNHFNKIGTSTASLCYIDTKWHIKIALEATQINNPVYFTTNALPAQYNAAMQVYKVDFAKNFRLGKWHLNTREVYQSVADNVPIRLPQLVTENSVFYENWLFHRAMLLRVGVDVYYNTSYYVYAYMPVTDQFYLQNDKQLGNYAYLDPFVSFRIKTFRMFITMDNVTSNMLQKGAFYAYALNYPMPDRVLRFGINWDFWN